MKKTICAFFLLLPVLAWCQNKVATSVDEYNYINRTYLNVLTSGWDMKLGYSTQFVAQSPNGTAYFGTYSHFSLLRFITNGEVHAYIIVHYVNDQPRACYCLATGGDLANYFYRDIDALTSPQKSNLLLLLAGAFVLSDK